MNNKKDPKPINIKHIDLEKMKEKTTDIPALLEYAHSIGGFAITPTEEGTIKNKALSAMEDQTSMQLEQIFEQMKLLANQAKKVQDRAEISYQIYNAKMSFEPIIGKTYYLYEKEDKKILSIISPKEWGKSIPFDKYIAEVKLLSDHTWSVISED